MNVELHIEELLLHGLGQGKEREIRATIERELGDLLAREGFAPSTRPQNLAQLDVGSFRVGPNSDGDSLGVKIAKNIHRGIPKQAGK